MPGIFSARYAHGVLVEGATRWLHSSGVVPVAPDGTVPTDVTDQARDEFTGGRRVASTLVTVPALAQPAWRLEVAIIAAR